MAVYIISTKKDRKLKIGFTTKGKNNTEIKTNLKSRYQTSLGTDIEIDVFITHYPEILENLVHEKLQYCNDSLELFCIPLSDAKKIIIELQKKVELLQINWEHIMKFLSYKNIQAMAKDLKSIAVFASGRKQIETDILKIPYFCRYLSAETVKKIAKHLFIKKTKKSEILYELRNISPQQENVTLSITKTLAQDIKKKYKIQDLDLFLTQFREQALQKFSIEILQKICKSKNRDKTELINLINAQFFKKI